MCALSSAILLAKKHFDKFYMLLEGEVVALQNCNWELQKAFFCKDKLSLGEHRREFVRRAYALARWGGLEIWRSEITPLVSNCVSSECRDDFIAALVKNLSYRIELFYSEEPTPYSDANF